MAFYADMEIILMKVKMCPQSIQKYKWVVKRWGIKFYTIHKKNSHMEAFISKIWFLLEQSLVVFKYKVISYKCLQH